MVTYQPSKMNTYLRGVYSKPHQNRKPYIRKIKEKQSSLDIELMQHFFYIQDRLFDNIEF